jgi:hypothetical protein
MKQKRYWLRGILIGTALVVVQTVLYLGCLPSEKGPYGFCGMIFAFPLGIITDGLLWKIPIVQLRMPVLILMEIVVVGGLLAIIGYFYGRIKGNKLIQ